MKFGLIAAISIYASDPSPQDRIRLYFDPITRVPRLSGTLMYGSLTEYITGENFVLKTNAEVITSIWHRARTRTPGTVVVSGTRRFQLFSNRPTQSYGTIGDSSIGISPQSTASYPRGLVLIPREEPRPHMELIFNPENIYNFCVESSIAYFPGSNEWSAGVEVFVGDIIPSASLHTSDKFLFKTNEPFDYIPRDDFDALVREINFQSSVSSAVQTNEWGNYIILHIIYPKLVDLREEQLSSTVRPII
jgi:hypothetical protein